jgi:hypothetical protein
MVADALTKAEVAFSYETLSLPYIVERKYKPDFILPNGVIIEVKGYWTGADRSKHLKVKEAHPDLDIRFCFMNAHNKLSKRSKTTYAQWCDKKGFKWCQRNIPKSWIL